LLVFDGDCGFCTRCARWAVRHGQGRVRVEPWQRLDLDQLGLTENEVTTAAYWVDDQGRTSGAHLAVGRCLEAIGGPYRPVGWLLRHRPVSWAASPAYRLLARNRHQMPGSSDTCRQGERG
jgi:predicted DCC family thiol-disulfide oxidoreductase YuxK